MSKVGRLTLLCLLFATALMSGCTEGNASKGSGKTPPPPLVKAQVVERSDIPLTVEYVGQTAGSREVEVRARVGGILLKRAYVEGSPIREGELMFTIDPEPFRADLAQANGQLARCKATLQQAGLDRDRILALYADGAVSTQERDNAITAYDAAEADVQAASARVREAAINLGYTEVRAPISGMTSKETRSEGSLVSTDAAGSLLTTITQLDPVYVNFSIPGTEALHYRKLAAEGKFSVPTDGYTVRIRMSDGAVYSVPGRINFSDKQVDPMTGSIRSRAEFSNPQGQVLPGQFVRVLLDGGVLTNALLIPQRAALFTQSGPIVYVLDDKGIPSPRPVVLGDTVGESFIVESGLEGGERIVAEGVVKVRPGMPVNVAGAAPAAPKGAEG
ncbi:membrane fusion protein (multidrug efflux system) [Desulfobaculum xiamenense]|uniref:Membrane fusion protein (Multidrug efflux system) n=1 Tax=Desulfobaculum xiamenense TaxID=995050 RepID=A0A846QSH4_9BACT|nr:efflux RND transporter periplasmic adaptor subunit [Desulfobaculum xiamenense]NJB68124.1 membrane fusion protein (multidrug efflux system) [Desulfobaculum xiamenense]